MGAFPVLALGRPIWALVLLVARKILADLGAHAASHTKKDEGKNGKEGPAARPDLKAAGDPDVRR